MSNDRLSPTSDAVPASDALTMGVEEEYQIVGARTRALKPRGRQIVHEAEREIGEHVSHELFLAQVEIGTPVCRSLADVREHITRSRRVVIEAARNDGDRIAAAGTHPFSLPLEQPITPKERYFGIAEEYQFLAREQMICGCHVHVGVPGREEGIHVLNRARDWLACFIALAGNSPFWQGEETGYSSFRTELWRRWPMAGSPHFFADRNAYDTLVRALVNSGAIDDETKIYWDLRVADRFSTVEFRATDVLMSVDEAVMVAGLCRALTQTSLDAAVADAKKFMPARPELLRAAEWRAARYGLDGELIDARAGESIAARDMIERLLLHLRPALENSGDWDEVAALTREVLERGNGASRQRAAFEQSGRMEDVVDYITQETARGVEETP